MSGFFHLFSQWEHVASIVSLARFSHFNPPCECRKGEEERWECQQGSTQQLRVINHCHDRERDGGWKTREMECSRHGRNLSPEMRWINVLSSYALLLIYGCDITSCSIPACSKAVKQESQLKSKGSACIVLRSTNIWIMHRIPASLSAPRGPEYPIMTTELCIMSFCLSRLGIFQEHPIYSTPGRCISCSVLINWVKSRTGGRTSTWWMRCGTRRWETVRELRESHKSKVQKQ